MSLLMDALRKAEESKKQAEQRNKSEAEDTADQSSNEPASAQEPMSAELSIDEPPAVESQAEEISEDAEQLEAEEKPEREVESPGSIPDFDLDLGEAEADDTLAATAPDVDQQPRQESSDELVPAGSVETDTTGEIIEQAEASIELELEPRDASLEHKPRQSLELEATEQEAVSPTQLSTEQSQENVGEADDADAESETTASSSETDEQDSEEVAPVVARAASTEASQESDESGDSSEPSPKAETAREQTDSSRRSAKSVFAAKRSAKKSRRNTQFAGIGIAAALLVGFGIFFALSLNSNSGITVPLDYVANQSELSNDFAGGAVERETVVVNQVTDPAATLAEEAVDVDVATAVVADAPESSITDSVETTLVGLADLVVNDASISEVIGAEPEVEVSEPTILTEIATISESNIVEPAEPESSLADNSASVPTGSPAVSGTAEADASVVASLVATPTNVISFSRRQSQSEIDPLLTDAYGYYQSGNLQQARDSYQQALLREPTHRDALLGLAAIAIRQEQPIQAMELYTRLLARNPSDPVARAGLLELRPAGGASEQERELRRLRESHPAVAPLVYALGNFYASQLRWSDAQQSYFDALQLARSDSLQGAAINPDYAFNLAVSLEHLNQPVPAENYYREALEQASSHPAGFDLNIARSRLATMGRTEP